MSDCWPAGISSFVVNKVISYIAFIDDIAIGMHTKKSFSGRGTFRGTRSKLSAAGYFICGNQDFMDIVSRLKANKEDFP